MVVVAHALMARGGELGRVEGKAFSESRGLRWCDIEWHRPGALPEAKGFAACTVHLCSVKDVEGRGQRFPIPIRRRAGPGQPRDAVCAYDELAAAYAEDVRLLGGAAAAA